MGPGFDWRLDFVGLWEGRCGGCVGDDCGGDCGGESVVVGGNERTHCCCCSTNTLSVNYHLHT